MKRLKDKTEIELLPYEGYLWYSDEGRPDVIDQNFHHHLLKDFPFVIEGLLYDKGSETSVHIKHIDGEYIITEYQLSEYKGTTKPQEYLPHRLPQNIKKICFTALWEEEAHPQLADGALSMLALKAHIFTGFKK